MVWSWFDEDGRGSAVPPAQVAPCQAPPDIQLHRVTCRVPPPAPIAGGTVPSVSVLIPILCGELHVVVHFPGII